jgi:hypothetical protein
MNYLQLVDKIVAVSHRKDLRAQVPQFVEDAQQQINDRLGLALVPFNAGTDTDPVLTEQPLLYFYPAMKSLYENIIEFETATYYDNLFQRQADAFYITAPGTTPLTITPEVPAP